VGRRRATSDQAWEARKAVKAHPDYKLIKACVEYGFLFGGSASGFAIDPTDSHFAGPVDCRNCERAEEIITRASKHRPVTLDGLAAKGAAAKLICALSDRNYIEDYEQDFLQSLAEDVCRFHKLAGGKRDSAPTHWLFAAESTTGSSIGLSSGFSTGTYPTLVTPGGLPSSVPAPGAVISR
jgi:hypothetical protein